MKKSFKILALVLIACVSFIFAGCDLFVRNDADFFNQTVVTVKYDDGKKIEISRKDFLTAYNNYGSNLINTYGYTEDKAIDSTIDALANRKILLEEAKNVLSSAEAKDFSLTEKDYKELYYQIYVSLINNVQQYEKEIREDWEMPEAILAEEITEEEKTIYTPYEKKARPVFDSVSGEYKIQKIESSNDIKRELEFNSSQEVYTKFIQETKANTSDKFAREEYRRYLASLQASQKVLGTNYSEEKLIKEEILRIFNNLEENKILERYEEYTRDNNGYSYITVDQVLNKYKSMVYSSKFNYENDKESYDKNMLESFKDVNYFIDDNYFYVAHILIKFNDSEQASFNSLEQLSNKGQGYIISAGSYESQKKSLYNSLKADVRDLETGEVTKDVCTAKDVLDELNRKLSNATTKEAKDEVFKQMMYKYNEDGGIMNADYPYVIGTENSKMVENFTNSSRELNDAGEYGAISGLVESEYGLHIIYYMGSCDNVVSVNTNGILEIQESDIVKLDEQKLNNLNNKTVFDLVYEQLTEDNYSEFENRNLNAIKQEKGIKIYVADNVLGE